MMRSIVGITLSLFFALVLALLPMPDWAIWFRPAWVLMILIYWMMELPDQMSVVLAWLMGLVLDILSGSLLGEHALAYVVVCYLVLRMSIRLRLFSLLQQSLSVFMFVFLAQFIVFCSQGFLGELPASKLYWMASLTSMLLWPWLYLFVRDMSRRFNVF